MSQLAAYPRPRELNSRTSVSPQALLFQRSSQSPPSERPPALRGIQSAWSPGTMARRASQSSRASGGEVPGIEDKGCFQRLEKRKQAAPQRGHFGARVQGGLSGDSCQGGAAPPLPENGAVVVGQADALVQDVKHERVAPPGKGCLDIELVQGCQPLERGGRLPLVEGGGLAPCVVHEPRAFTLRHEPAAHAAAQGLGRVVD